MTGEGGNQVAMIGIDAGDLDLIRSWLDDLPRLRTVLERGPLHVLRSPADTLTSAVWPTFATGLPPGEHGVYYPMQWDPATMQLRRVSSDWITFEPFWYELARAGVRVTTLDVPFSLPSRLEQGVEVINWGSQECLGPFQGNRTDVVRQIRQRFGHHPMGEDVPVEPTSARLRKLRTALVEGAARKGEVARWLMQNTDWDLFVTVFAETHRGGHALWPGGDDRRAGNSSDALRDVYRAVDAAIGRVVETAGPDATIVVFSVHGTGPNDTQEHFAPAIVDRIHAHLRGESITDEPPKEGGGSPMAMLRRMVPGQVQYLLAKMLPVGVRDWVVARSFLGGLDWGRTSGFLLPASCESYLRLNLAGREREGALAAGGEEIGRYTSTLRDELLALEEVGTGARVVRDVVASAERFPGSRSHLLPDYTVLWEARPPATAIRSEHLGTMTGRHTTGRTGDHRPEGFAVVNCPRDGTDRAPPPEDVVDLARLARDLLGASTSG